VPRLRQSWLHAVPLTPTTRHTITVVGFLSVRIVTIVVTGTLLFDSVPPLLGSVEYHLDGSAHIGDCTRDPVR
jgi:hypothetical protein